jgi:AcrR family transcriptional regulator
MEGSMAMGVDEKFAGERRISRQREAGEVTRRETRRRLLVAAGLEFAERGYAAATVTRIAERAGVSLQSLYSAWGSKRALLRAVMETAVTGEPESDGQLRAGEPPAPLRAELRDDDVGDPRELIGRLAHLYRRLAERSAIGWRTYKDAAAVDPEIAADWRQLMDIRRANVTAVAGRIPREFLRDGLTAEAAGDTVWAIASPDTQEMLVRHAGYSYDAYEEWVRRTLCAALLRN